MANNTAVNGMARSHGGALPWVMLAAWVAACTAGGSGGNGDNSNLCTPGQQVACACLGGAMGFQTCQGNGTFDACQCGVGSGASTGGSSGGSGTLSSGGSGAVASSSGGTSSSVGSNTSSNAASSSAAATSGSASSSGGTASSNAPTNPDAPVVQSVNFPSGAVFSLGDRSNRTFSVVVSDAQGVTNLRTVEMRDVATNALLDAVEVPVAGAGTTTTLTGAFSLDSITMATSLTFFQQTQRTLRVTATDAEGHTGATEFPITIQCSPSDPNSWACGNMCTDVSTSVAHCGQCGRTLPTDGNRMAWSCYQGRAFLSISSAPTLGDTCNAICARVQQEAPMACEPFSYSQDRFAGTADYQTESGGTCFFSDGNGNTSDYLRCEDVVVAQTCIGPGNTTVPAVLTSINCQCLGGAIGSGSSSSGGSSSSSSSSGGGGSSSSSGGAPAGWACDPSWYGTDDGCDCGCGALDADCSGTACTQVGCTAPACGYCQLANGDHVPCNVDTGGQCVEDLECRGGRCINAWRDGYCSEPCGAGDPCNTGEICVNNSFCAVACSTSNVCRSEYVCRPTNTGSACLGSGVGSGAVGDTCSVVQDCAGGNAAFCDTDFAGGACTLLNCTAPSNPTGPTACPSGSHCMFNAPYDSYQCNKNCTSNADCRSGIVCRDEDNDGTTECVPP